MRYNDKLLYNSDDIYNMVSAELQITPKKVKEAVEAQIKYIKTVLIKDPEVGVVRIPYVGDMYFNVGTFFYYKRKIEAYKRKGIKLSSNEEKDYSIGMKRTENISNRREERYETIGFRKKLRHYYKRVTSLYYVTGGKSYRDIEELQKEYWIKANER